MKYLKCYKIKIFGFLISVLSTSSAFAAGPLACDFSSNHGAMVTVNITNSDIKDAVLKMPRTYITSRGFRDNSNRKALLLRAYNTDFKPYPTKDFKTKDGRQKISLGIDDSYSILLSGLIPLKRAALRHISSYYKLGFENPETDIEGELGKYGLYNPRHKIPSKFSKTVYLGKKDNKITDVISCNQQKENNYPQCSHLFEAGAYDIKISYSKVHLESWQKLRNGTEKLLQCFTIKEPIELPSLLSE